MDPIIDPPPACLSDMLMIGHRITSHTIGEIRNLEAALAAAQARISEVEHLDSVTAGMLRETEQALANVTAERDTARAEAEALRSAWKLAKRQNECDMILTGDEIRTCNAAIGAARSGGMPGSAATERD
jgi:hypothetical protein